jgi:hypothetical protein
MPVYPAEPIQYREMDFSIVHLSGLALSRHH